MADTTIAISPVSFEFIFNKISTKMLQFVLEDTRRYLRLTVYIRVAHIYVIICVYIYTICK